MLYGPGVRDGVWMDDDSSSEPEEDFSMTAYYIHFDEDSKPKKRKESSWDDDDFSMTGNYFHD
jgi:hypothetical protein